MGVWAWIVYYALFGWIWKKSSLSIVFVSINGVPYKGDKKMAIINDISQIVLTFECRNKRGNLAQVYGTPVWETGTPGIVALVPAADGLSCVAKAAGELGDGNVTIRAFVDPEKTVERSASATIGVAAGPGAALFIIEGETTVQDDFV